MSSGPLCLLVRLRIPAAAQAAAIECLEQLARHSRREPGCRAYNVHRAQDDGSGFVIYELYDDAAALEAHRASAHFARWAALLHQLAEAREAVLYDPVAVAR